MIQIGTDEFIELAKNAILYVASQTFDATDNIELTTKDIYFVTCTYILGNIKGMFSTSLPDGKYYEVTYNTEKNEIYVDQYTKTRNETITVTESTEEENED